MTFPDPEYNAMDFNSAYPYSLGPNSFDAMSDIAAPFTNNYPEGPQDGMTYFGFHHLLTMEDALPEELR